MLVNTCTAVLPLKENSKVNVPVVLIMPFNPKMTPGRERESRLKLLLGKAERELMARFSVEIAMPVIRKVQQAVKSLNGNTHRSSVAIFVTGGEIQILYMDIPVVETLVIDAPFAVKDILDHRVDEREFLVLMLSAGHSCVYLSDGGRFRIIKSNTPQQMAPGQFLHQIDQGLGAVLAAYPRPVFVVGDPDMTGVFKSLTRHEKNIVAYLQEDGKCLEAWLDEWERVREIHALNLVEKAADAGDLVAGIEAVSRQAGGHSSRLLVVEKGFTGAGKGSAGTVEQAGENFLVKDAVDQIVWQVLGNGGHVERVEKDSLKHCGRIALLKSKRN